MRCVRVLACATQFAALVVCLTAHAQVPQDQVWGPNGPVRAVAVSNNTIYLGGVFTRIGPPTGGFVAFDPNTAAPLQPYAGVVGIVNAVAWDGAGGWYIGGSFSSVQGQPRDGLAQIDASGHVTAFASGFTMTGPPLNAPSINSITVSGSRVYFGGRFVSVDGQARSNAAACDVTTGALTPWNPDPTNASDPASGSVTALVAFGSSIYVGGSFDAVDGQAVTSLAAVDTSSGVLTGWAPSLNGTVICLALRVLDRFPFTVTIYAGGTFTTVNGQAHWHVAAIDAGTGTPFTWAPFVSGNVRAILPPLQGGPVYIGGDFSTINGVPRQCIAALDLTTGSVLSWDPGANGSVTGLTIFGSSLYACGGFTTIGGVPRNGLAAIDLTTGAPTSWDPAAGASSTAIAAGANAIFVGGHFTTAGGVPRAGLAAIDATTGLPTNWTADVSAGGGVLSMVASGGKLYVGGVFNSIGGVARSNAAAIDLSTGALTGWQPVLTGAVTTMALSGNVAYLGGLITSAGGQPRNNLAAVDLLTGSATNWHPPSFNTGNLGVNALAVKGGFVYVGGVFSFMGGIARTALAAVDTATGALGPWDPQLAGDGAVLALANDGTNIWVGGSFDHAGGRPRDDLAALDPNDGHANTWDDYADAAVFAFALDYPTLYVAGRFSSLGGDPHVGLASVDLTNGEVRPWAADFSGTESDPVTVQAIALSPGRVVVGGSFDGVAGHAQSNFAVLQGGATTAVDLTAHAPPATALRTWPNPFRSQLVVSFAQPRAGDVDVAIYDVAGRFVRRLHRGPLPPGTTNLRWDGRDEAGAGASAGLYLVRANSSERVVCAKILRLE